MAETCGKQYGRKCLFVGIVFHHGIVECLAGKCDLVFSGGQLFAELHHVLVGLEVRIGLHHNIEFA